MITKFARNYVKDLHQFMSKPLRVQTLSPGRGSGGVEFARLMEKLTRQSKKNGRPSTQEEILKVWAAADEVAANGKYRNIGTPYHYAAGVGTAAGLGTLGYKLRSRNERVQNLPSLQQDNNQ